MIGQWLQRHPLPGFFALAFGISWGGILIVIASRGFDLSALQPLEGGLIFLMMLLGPSVSGLTCTALLKGGTGLHTLWRSAGKWHVAPGWLTIALLTSPALLLLTLLGFATLAGPVFTPGFQWKLFGVGLVAGSFEEIGWTGFATPRLLARHRLGKAGLILGVIWAVWHLLVDFRYNFGAMGVVWPLEFAVVYLATLTPYRMLMTWVFARSQSLLIAILMHASFTGWLLALFPAAPTLAQNLAWQAAFALALWAAVGAVLYFEPAPRLGWPPPSSLASPRISACPSPEPPVSRRWWQPPCRTAQRRKGSRHDHP
jgi:membrane protease YdiL (CAAX protease family)